MTTYIQTCQCGKRCYASRSDARQVSRRLGGHVDEYRCGDYWHCGHLPRAVIRGEVARSRLVVGRQRSMT